MKRLRLGTGFAVFMIFFGAAVLDALQNQYWPRIVFWLLTGTIFIVFDNLRRAH